jgi:hypothetical protein
MVRCANELFGTKNNVSCVTQVARKDLCSKNSGHLPCAAPQSLSPSIHLAET